MEQIDPEDRFDRFACDHFSGWPSTGRPAAAADRLRCVRAWLTEQTVAHHAAALALIADIRGVLDELQARIPSSEKSRLFYRIDVEHLSKSADSILDKMMRGYDSSAKKSPAHSFGNFTDEMRDLARFRIVANFLSDVEMIQAELTSAYGSAARTTAQQKLKDGFVLEKNSFDDCTHLLPAERNKGERCFKACFWPRGKPGLKVEVQVMTILQEAWDKKDHFLVYEPRRRGAYVDRNSEIQIFAMSELLYIADLTFDRLKKEILTSTGGEDATS